MTDKATHTPWTIGLNGYNAHIIYEGEDSVATVFGVPINSRVENCTGPKWAEGMERANRIVHAVNSHHDLIEALRVARTSLSITRTNIMCEIGRCADPSESRWAGVPEQLAKRIAKIDAIITKEAGQ